MYLLLQRQITDCFGSCHTCPLGREFKCPRLSVSYEVNLISNISLVEIHMSSCTKTLYFPSVVEIRNVEKVRKRLNDILIKKCFQK